MIRLTSRTYLLTLTICLLLGVFLSGCGTNSTPNSKFLSSATSSTSTSGDIALENCQGESPHSTVMTAAPVASQTTLYVPAASRLFAVNASNGAVRWCQQVKVTRKFVCPMSCPPPPQAFFGGVRAVNDTIYACVSGYESGYVYAFAANDGALRWRTQTDCGLIPMSYGDMVPLVARGIVHSGSYALYAQTGKVLWRVALDEQAAAYGTLSLQILIDNTIYASTEDSIYAVNMQNGGILWRYTTTTRAPIAGPLLVSGQMLYFGTLGDADGSEKSEFYALDTATGKLRWQYQMGDYQAVIQGDVIYVCSDANVLRALDKNTGTLLWKRAFSYPTNNTVESIGHILYFTSDGIYALNSANGATIWHSLSNTRDNYFAAPTLGDGVIYLVGIDGSGQSTLYALDARDGSVYWQSNYPYQLQAPAGTSQ